MKQPSYQSSSKCSCDNVKIDENCNDTQSDPHGGLGCNACRIVDCRIWGNGGYINC